MLVFSHTSFIQDYAFFYTSCFLFGNVIIFIKRQINVWGPSLTNCYFLEEGTKIITETIQIICYIFNFFQVKGIIILYNIFSNEVKT